MESGVAAASSRGEKEAAAEAAARRCAFSKGVWGTLKEALILAQASSARE